MYGAAAPCPVSPQSQPNGGITKTTGPTRFFSLVRAKLSSKMATLWDTAGASALRGTSEQMSAFSLYKPPFGGGPPSEPKFFASSEPKLFYKLTSVWEQATAPAARTNVNFPRSQIASNLLGATRQPTDEEGAGGLPLHPHARHLPRASRDYTEGWHPRGRGDASTRNFAVDDSIGAS